MEETSAIITAVATSFIAVAACGATIVAAIGLHSWKDQKKWEHESETARKILVLIYMHRDAIKEVRSPAILRSETDAAMTSEDRAQAPEQRRYLEFARVYEKRWERVSEIRAELYPHLLDADAVWGEGIRKMFEKVWELETELKICVIRYLKAQNPNVSASAREAADRHFSKNRDILYDEWDENDQFTKDYLSAVKPLEHVLREKFTGRK